MSVGRRKRGRGTSRRIRHSRVRIVEFRIGTQETKTFQPIITERSLVRILICLRDTPAGVRQDRVREFQRFLHPSREREKH